MEDLLPEIVQPSPYGEIATTAAAAHAKAMVESRYYMAIRNPRKMDEVRQSTLKECRIPGFAANKSTYYIKPIGKGVEGLGIRFVEMALRNMKNVMIETTMVHEDDLKEVHRVSVTDLEANITYPLDIKVSKTVERSKPNDDGSYISMRKNSSGKAVFTVPATDDDLLNKRAALVSKAIRTLGLRIIPGDIQDEAKEIILKIRADKAAKDPDGERKAICDGFAKLGVRASDLIEYLEHDLAQCSPAELVQLRGLWGAISEGETTWKAIMDSKGKPAAGKGDDKKCAISGRITPAGCKTCAKATGCVDPRNPTAKQTAPGSPPRRKCPDQNDAPVEQSFCDESCDEIKRAGCPGEIIQ